MVCYHPIKVIDTGLKTIEGKRRYKFLKIDEIYKLEKLGKGDLIEELPCGKSERPNLFQCFASIAKIVITINLINVFIREIQTEQNQMIMRPQSIRSIFAASEKSNLCIREMLT